MNEIIEFSDLPLAEIFQETRLLITTASSAAIEAVACGVYVAIVGNRSGPTINRLSGYIDESYWSTCYTVFELENAISRQVVLEKIDINKYFHPINQANVVKMMTFD